MNFRLLQNANGIIRLNPDYWGALLFHNLFYGNVFETKNSIGSDIHQYGVENEKFRTFLVMNYKAALHEISVNSQAEKYLFQTFFKERGRESRLVNF